MWTSIKNYTFNVGCYKKMIRMWASIKNNTNVGFRKKNYTNVGFYKK